MKKVRWIVILLFLLGCEDRYSKYIDTADVKIDPVVLFNIEDFNREKLAHFINEVSQCGPKVIGLNVGFNGLHSPKEDSILAASIRNSWNVILTKVIDRDRAVKGSDPFFSDVAKENGVISFFQDEREVVTSYIPLFENSAGQEPDFCYLLAFYYNPSLGRELFKTINVNEAREIRYFKELNQFESVSVDNIDCDLIKDKIVIFGYLGPLEENTEVTPFDQVYGKGGRTYSTVIIANIVLNYLNQK